MMRSYRILLSSLSGILLSLAWLGFPGWILFFALIPLLWLEHFFVEHSKEFRGVSFWGHTLLTFFIWNLATTWWIVHATAAGAAMAIVTNSFLMSLVWWLAHAARRNFRANLGYIALICFWISFEYFHFHWDIEWPWLTLGNGFANNHKMVQWYEFTGTLGGTLWVLTLNILLFRIIKNFVAKAPLHIKSYPIAGSLILLLVPIAISFSIYYFYEEKGEAKNIVIVQPNIDPYSENFDMAAENQKLETFLRLARSKTDENTDYILGPETLFEEVRYWNENELDGNRQLRQLKQFLQHFPGTEMIFGVSSFKDYPDKKSAPPTARTRNNMTYDMFNTALFIDAQGNVQIYHKSILVVGVEKMPFMKYLGFLGDLVIDIGGTSNSLGRQEKASNFISGNGVNIAPVICYESVFGGYVTQYVQKGAELIFIITNDGWWKNTPGYRQHQSFAKLRAIETRRSIARAANTGISCFINQRGDVFNETDWWTETAISGTIKTNNEITFYVKYGDYIARVAMFVGVLLLLLLISKRFTQKGF